MISKAKPAHYRDIIRIYNQAVDTGVQTADSNRVSLDEKKAWLDLHTGEHYVIYVILMAEKVAGYLALSPYRHGRSAFYKTAEISYYLDAEFQGQGLGARLLEHAMAQCPALGIESLVAILLSCNTASIALLEKFAFETWGCMPGIAKIKTRNVDHLYYGKHLPGACRGKAD